jgi:hypothetical protein
VKFCCEIYKHFMGMILRPRCNRRSGWGKDLLDENGTDDSVKDRSDFVYVFLGGKTVHYEFVPRSQMVNRQLSQDVLARLSDAVCRNRPELWGNQTWMLHHDNETAHVSRLIRIYLA